MIFSAGGGWVGIMQENSHMPHFTLESFLVIWYLLLDFYYLKNQSLKSMSYKGHPQTHFVTCTEGQEEGILLDLLS